MIKPLLNKDEDLDKLVRLIGVKGTDSKKGHFTLVHEDFIEALGGRIEAKGRVEKRLSKLSSTQFELKAIYQCFITGESFYRCDATKREGFKYIETIQLNQCPTSPPPNDMLPE